MKTFTQLLESRQLNVQEDVINIIPVDKIEKYLEIANKFISPESKEIIQFMIDNEDYANMLSSNKNSSNIFNDFYSKKCPKDPVLRKVYSNLNKIANNNRLLEIPNLQTNEQFTSIINRKVAPDEILLDLKSENGRNEVAKRYTPLVNKIAFQWYGKVNLTNDEIKSAAWEGLTNAMNNYGKKKTISNDEEENKMRATTFGQYAAYAIRFAILDDVKNVSQNVRVPVSVQNKERKDTGINRKSNSISGDKRIGDDEKSKTLFDMVGGTDNGTSDIDNNDLNRLWSDVFARLDKEFDKKVMFAWYSFMGLNNHDKLKNKEIAKKLNCNPSLITYYCNNVNEYIRKDASILKMMKEIYELMKECLHEHEHDNDIIEEGLYITNDQNKFSDDE